MLDVRTGGGAHPHLVHTRSVPDQRDHRWVLLALSSRGGSMGASLASDHITLATPPPLLNTNEPIISPELSHTPLVNY